MNAQRVDHAPIAIVTGDFVKTGGMDRANLALAGYAARDGRELHLVAHRVDPELSNRPNVAFHRARKPLNSYTLGEPFLEYAGKRCARSLADRGGRVIVNGANCDWPDVNWVHYVHAAWTGAGWKHRRALRREARILPKARLVIANSQRTKRDLIERVGVAADRIRVVYYGIDAEQFRPPASGEREATRRKMGLPLDRPIVAFVGSPDDRRKGFDVVQRVWSQLSFDANLIVIGRADHAARWKGEDVWFTGFCDDVPAILRGCDALVSPTRYEAYGLGVHEAICCGLPAIVSASAGVAELFPASLSELLLPDPDDADDLTARLRRWRSLHGQPAFTQSVNDFAGQLRSRSWDNMAEDMLAMLDDANDLPVQASTGVELNAN